MRTLNLIFQRRRAIFKSVCTLLLCITSFTLQAQTPWHVDAPNSIFHLDYKVGIGTKRAEARLMVLTPEKDDILRLANKRETVVLVKYDGLTGLGTVNPNARLHINANPNENPLRVAVNGTTGILAHYNGGLSIGSGSRPPQKGLKVNQGGTVLFGSDTLGVGSKMMWLPSKSAFRGGEVIQVVGTGADVWNTANIGEHSFAFGLGPSAKGNRAVSMGSFSNAEGDNSVALGAGRAYGDYSIALGSHPVAEGSSAVALGKNTKATGDYTLATGYGSEATGIRSTALGYYTKAIASHATAIGKNNIGLDNGLFEVGMGVSGSQRQNAFTIFNDGTIGVGTTYVPTSYKMAVDGGIICETVRVELSQNWPDYVFQNDYALPSLDEVQKHIDAKGHLPGIPAASEVEKEGIDLGDMQVKMMEKIEELTLYILQQEQRIKNLEAELNK